MSVLKLQDQPLGFAFIHLTAFELEFSSKPLTKLKVQPEMDSIPRKLAAENSDFGVTGELLAECELSIDSTERRRKRSKHGTLVLHRCRPVAVQALQTLPSTFF